MSSFWNSITDTGNLQAVAYTSVLSGAFAYLGARYINGISVTNGTVVRLFGMDYSPATSVAVLVAASCFVSEFTSHYLIPMLPSSLVETFGDNSAAMNFVAPVVSGVVADRYFAYQNPGEYTQLTNGSRVPLWLTAAGGHWLGRMIGGRIRSYFSF